MTELIADVIVSCLLLLTTAWCILVYRRLQRLKIDREDLVASIAALDQAASRAEGALAAIRDATQQAESRMARPGASVDARGRGTPLGAVAARSAGQPRPEPLARSSAMPAARPSAGEPPGSGTVPARGGRQDQPGPNGDAAGRGQRLADASFLQRIGTLR